MISRLPQALPGWNRDESALGTLRARLANLLANDRVREVIGADLRSLAALRIALAVIVLFDVVARIPYLRIHYSDSGVLPRDIVIDGLGPWRWSLNFIAGADLFQAILFGITILAAIGMLLGYYTRWMTFIVWVMVMSLQARNPMVLSSADSLLRLVLFWSMFLPLGAWWSLDRQRLGYPVYRSMRFVSVATVGLFAQIACMYLFTAILKSGDEWRVDGTALYYAFGAQHLTRDLGEFFLQFELMLKVLTFGSLGLEFLIPVLVFIPFWTAPIRTAIVVLTMAFHLGIFSTMDLGIFPLISALCMTCFLPTRFWDRILPAMRDTVYRRRPVQKVDRSLARGIATVQARVAEMSWIRSSGVLQDDGGDRRGYQKPPTVSGGAHDNVNVVALRSRVIVNMFAAMCLVIVLAWNVSTVSGIEVPSTARPVGQTLGLYQRWAMFAPHPPLATSWYVYKGTLADGTELDVLPTVVQDDLGVIRSVSWDRPDNISSDLYGNKYWRKYLDEIASDDRGDERRAFAGYICRLWNGHYADNIALVELDVYRLVQPTLSDAERAPVLDMLVSQYTCTT